MICKHCGGTGKEPDWREQGEQMRQVRKKQKMTLRELARRLKITPAYLSDMENGRRQYLPKWQAWAPFLFLLLSIACLNAQQLKIVVGNETNATSPGLIGLPVHSSDTRSLTILEVAPGMKLLAMNIEVRNTNNFNWTPVGTRPTVQFDPFYDAITARCFIRISLRTTTGAEVLPSVTIPAVFRWDAVPLFLPDRVLEVPGILAGSTVSAQDSFLGGTFINIFGVPNGLYTLGVQIDPKKIYNVQDEVSVEIELRDEQVRLR